jgi:threonine aldolase
MRVDLRSDTVTSPSAAMREVMAHAPVGDDVYGEDPTVNSLEERVAEMFGTEAALFTPSGSLANQLAIRMLVAPGEELLTETFSHIVRAELGAGAVFSGITTRTWLAPRGLLKASDVLDIAKPNSGPYQVSTTAIAVENTHNFGGGTIQPIDQIEELSKGARHLGLAMHLDGARIWNAHVESAISFKEYAQYFDTISVCFSKGLGAPVGSLMLSTQERVARARIWRKRYGAGMRQVGILAAACHFALDNNLQLLSKDHQRARTLAQHFYSVAPACVSPHEVETNIVILDLSDLPLTAPELVASAQAHNVMISALGPNVARLVTHLDIDDASADYAADVIGKILKSALVAK